MAKVMLVSVAPSCLAELQGELEAQGAVIRWARSGREVLDTVGDPPVDLMVADDELGDMSGLQLIRQLVVAHPLINCALVSALAPEAFHAASEGLGILMQLPPAPSAIDTQRLMARLGQITGHPDEAG